MGIIINPNEYGSLLYDKNEIDSVNDVILNSKIFRYASSSKTKTDLFEEDLAKFMNKKYALGVNNGTSGLKVALKAVGLQPGERVLVSAYTFLASATSVFYMGGIPIPIDTDLNYGMNLDQLEKELIKGCRTIIIVHFQGKCFNIRPVIELCKKYNVKVIEDACQAMGTMNNGQYAGTFADIGVFSFQQNKPISCGEGGVLITDNEDLYVISRNFADMGGVREWYPSWDKPGALIGDNYRMNNLQGAILLEQLKKFNKINSIQKDNKAYLINNINTKNIKGAILNYPSSDDTGINLLIKLNDENMAQKIINDAKKENIEIRFLWSKPYYLQKVMVDALLTPKNLNSDDCNNAENISKTLVSINLPPILTHNQLDSIASFINKFFKEYDI